MDQCVASGAIAASSAAEAARGCRVLFFVVVNQSQTEAVLFGPQGVANTMAADGVFLSCATMAPDAARDLARRLEAVGPHYLDAPISGGAARASRGELTVLASGSEAAFRLARPALGAEPGIGAGFKMINQLLACVHILPPQRPWRLPQSSTLISIRSMKLSAAQPGTSWMFQSRVPHILAGDYTPRSSVEIFVKDIGTIDDMARAERFPVPLAAAALQLYLAASGSGHGQEDDSAVAKVYAGLSGARLRTWKE